MAKNPTEKVSTNDTLSSVKYQRAQGINVSIHGSTAPQGGEVRTVVTTTLSGTLDLRYAPRNPTAADKNTGL